MTVVAATLGAAITSLADPVLNTVFPPGGKAGTTVEVAVAGTELERATQLHFSVPGIVSKPKLNDKQQPEAGKFLVTLPASAPQGICDVRVMGPCGVSNPRGFAIGALTESVLAEAHLSEDKPFKAALETVISGRVAKNGVTHVAVELKKGRRCFVICQAVDLDSRIEPEMSLQGPQGRVVAKSKGGRLLDITPPEDGAHLLRLNDVMYRGGDEYPFRLVMTTTPQVEMVFEEAGKAVLLGRALPGGSPCQSLARGGEVLDRLEMPSEKAKILIAASTIQPARFGAPSESPDADAEKAVALDVPGRFAGWFGKGGRPRTFSFSAKKGDVLWIEVASAARGLASDPYLIVERQKKDSASFELVAESYDLAKFADEEEAPGNLRDCALRIEAKEDGTYRARVRDLFCNSPSKPRHPFEITVRRESADFELLAVVPSAPKAKNARNADVMSLCLWKGGLAALKVIAERKAGFTGKIDLSVSGLPPGVTCSPAAIGEGKGSGFVVLQAAPDAADWCGPVSIKGAASTLAGLVERTARGTTVVWKAADTTKEALRTRGTQSIVLGVTSADAAPAYAELAPGAQFEVAAGAKAILPLKIARQPDFTEAMKLKPLGLGAPDQAPEADVAAKGAEAKLELDTAKLKLAPGEHSFVLQGAVKARAKRGTDPAKLAVKDVPFLVYSKPITIRVKEAAKK